MTILRRLRTPPDRVYIFVHSARHPVAFLLTVGTLIIGVTTLLNPYARPDSIRSQLDPATQRAWSAMLVIGASLLICGAFAERARPRASFMLIMSGAGLYAFGCLVLAVTLTAQFRHLTVSGAWGFCLFAAYGWWTMKLLLTAWRARRSEEAGSERDPDEHSQLEG